MADFLAFLRAVNLGAKRVFPKADIQRVAESAGFEDIRTHLNTGNVRVSTRMRSRAKIEDTLERAFAADRGFDVPTIAFSATEFADIAAETHAVHAAHPGAVRHYVYLLKEEPDAEACAALAGTASERGEMIVRGRAVHAVLQPGYTAGQVDPLSAARFLGVATNRTHSVVTGLADRWL